MSDLMIVLMLALVLRSMRERSSVRADLATAREGPRRIVMTVVPVCSLSVLEGSSAAEVEPTRVQLEVMPLLLTRQDKKGDHHA